MKELELILNEIIYINVRQPSLTVAEILDMATLDRDVKLHALTNPQLLTDLQRLKRELNETH